MTGTDARTPPSAPEIEQGLLSCLMASPSHVGALCASAHITTAHFHEPSHGTVYDFLMAIVENRDEFDILSATQGLRDAGQLDSIRGRMGGEWVSGAHFLTLLSNLIGPYTAHHHAIGYIQTLRQKYILRTAIKASEKTIQDCHESQGEVSEIVADSQRTAATLNGLWNHQRAKRKSRAEIVAGIMGAYRIGDREQIVGRLTGIVPLDSEIGGLSRKELLVIAGSWSSGKSSLTLQIADQWATAYEERVIFFTFDDPEEALIRRLIQMRAQVNLAESHGQSELGNDDHARLSTAAQEATTSRIEFIDDIASHRNVQAVCATSRAMHAQTPLGMVILDFDEQIKDKQRGESDEQALANIAVGLKNLALELNCVVILLSQVTTDEKTGKVVTRGSAAKLQAAQKALLIVRGEREDRRTIKIWKNKTGKPGGNVEMGFHGKTFRFYELTEEERTEPPNTAKKPPRR